MSWQATAWAINQRVGDPTSKLLLLTLANYADDEGCCWPKQSTLAYFAEVDERTVRRKLQRLREMGLIETITRPGDGSGRKSDVTRLVMAPGQYALQPTGHNARPTGQPRQGNRTLESGVYEPSSESVIEPSVDAGVLVLTPTEPGKRSRGKKPKLPMPDNFKLDASMSAFAAGHGFTGTHVARMFERFKNHHLAKGNQWADWGAAWRTWVLNQVEFAQRDAAARQPQSMVFDERGALISGKSSAII